MHIRPFQRADLSAMADIMAKNNLTDTLSRFMTRDIDKYPFTYRMGCLRFLTGIVEGRGTVTFVAETDPEDTPSNPTPGTTAASDGGGNDDAVGGTTAPTLTGYISFHRHTSSPSTDHWHQNYNADWLSSLDRYLLSLKARYNGTPWFMRSEHTFNHDHMSRIGYLLNRPWDQEVFADSIEVLHCYTRQSYQRRGVGKMLMQWGKERAIEEGVPLIVAGSPIGGVAYRAMGFVDVGSAGADEGGFGEWFDEVAMGGEGMRRWCWEPNNEGRWVEKAIENIERERQERKKVEREGG
jgi:GNAT superfamily N-acetyltransferase